MKRGLTYALILCGAVVSAAIASQAPEQDGPALADLREKYQGLTVVQANSIIQIINNNPSNPVVHIVQNPNNFSIYLDGGVRLLSSYLRWRGVALPDNASALPIVLTGPEAQKIIDLMGEIQNAILFHQ